MIFPNYSEIVTFKIKADRLVLSLSAFLSLKQKGE